MTPDKVEPLTAGIHNHPPEEFCLPIMCPHAAFRAGFDAARAGVRDPEEPLNDSAHQPEHVHGPVCVDCAALAAPDLSAALDVERLAEALAKCYTGGAPLDRKYYVTAAAAVAREYAALAIPADETPTTTGDPTPAKPCSRYFGSDGTVCATHGGRFSDPNAATCVYGRRRVTPEEPTDG